jgi:hypothetical protein
MGGQLVTTSSIPLDVGLLAFLDMLNRQPGGKLANNDETLIEALKREGHVFNAQELGVVKTFAQNCAHVENKDGALMLTSLGRRRLETAAHKPVMNGLK